MKSSKLSTFAAVLLFFGCVSIYQGVKDRALDKIEPKQFTVAMKDGFLTKGDIIEGDLEANLGPFEESYSTIYGMKSSDSEYIYTVYFNDKFIGVKAYSSDMIQKFDMQANQTYDLLDKKTVATPVSVHFKGKVIEMSNEDLEYAKSYLVSMGFSEQETINSVYPYIIDCSDFSGGGLEVKIGIGFLIIGLLIFMPNILHLLSSIKKKTSYANDNYISTSSTSVNRKESDLEFEVQKPAYRMNPFDEARESQDTLSENDNYRNTNQDESNKSGGLKLKL